VRLLATGLALYSLYWVLGIVQPLVLPRELPADRARPQLPVLSRVRHAPRGERSALSRSTGVLSRSPSCRSLWPLIDFDNFIYRAADPTTLRHDARRHLHPARARGDAPHRGWVLPVTANCFILYTFYGRCLDSVGLGLIAHRGPTTSRASSGTIYMTLEGVFGVPLDVAASYIILFSIYGAGARRVRARQVLPRMVDGGGRQRPAAARAGPRGDGRRPSARHRLGQRRRETR
jgi:hypothetical protein